MEVHDLIMQQTQKDITRITKLLKEAAERREQELNSGAQPNLKLVKVRR